MTIRYYTSEQFQPPTVLRDDGEGRHEAFVKGKWQPTESIMQWMVGENNFVDSASEAEARVLAPAAFTT